ncbi:MAG: DUF3592 domain-containing protein [Terracidiphilus sp.]|nr:DUF3592 domain-containing protein [Terracidiphilus sp.]
MFDTGNSVEENDHSGSFMYWSIPYCWFKELRLSSKAKEWVLAQGEVTYAHRTAGGYRETIRAELAYSYTFNGEYFSGQTVRECCFDASAATALVEDNEIGTKIEIRVNPDNPDESYFPSGFGSIEPLLTLLLSVLGTLLLIFIVVGVFASEISKH